MITVGELENTIISLTEELQKSNGNFKVPVSKDTCIFNLEGFDSLRSLELSALLSMELGKEISPELLLQTYYLGENPTISEISNYIYKILKESD